MERRANQVLAAKDSPTPVLIGAFCASQIHKPQIIGSESDIGRAESVIDPQTRATIINQNVDKLKTAVAEHIAFYEVCEGMVSYIGIIGSYVDDISVE